MKISVNNNVNTLEGIHIPDIVAEYDNCLSCDVSEIKPYLFPISSMTDEQLEEFEKCGLEGYHDYDWYNKNHFDYRGLIPMGLAIDCTNLNIY